MMLLAAALLAAPNPSSGKTFAGDEFSMPEVTFLCPLPAKGNTPEMAVVLYFFRVAPSGYLSVTYQKPPSSKPLGSSLNLLDDGRLNRVQVFRDGALRTQIMEYVNRKTKVAALKLTMNYQAGSRDATISILPDRKSVGAMNCYSVPMPPTPLPAWAKEKTL